MMQTATFAIPGDIDTPTGGYIYEKQLLLALRRGGLRVRHLQLPGGFPNPTAEDMAVTAQALAELPAHQPVILDGFLPGAMPPETLRQMKAPFIAVTHHPLCYETGIDPARARYLRQAETENLHRAAHVVVPSQHTAQMLVQDFGVPRDRITVAPPGTARAPSLPPADCNEARVLSVGQLVPRKGHDTLIAALAAVADVPWTATLIGRDTDQAYGQMLRDQVRQFGLEDRIEFAGYVAPDALTQHYAAASLFALATHYEGYGMVFAEAMAHGLPIVTCDGGAVSQTVPGDAGLLTPVGDATAFATALRRVLVDDALRRQMSTASARHGRALPDWDTTARHVACLITEIASQA